MRQFSVGDESVPGINLDGILSMPGHFFERLISSSSQPIVNIRMVFPSNNASDEPLSLQPCLVAIRGIKTGEKDEFDVISSSMSMLEAEESTKGADSLSADESRIAELKRSLSASARSVAIANNEGVLEWLNPAAAEFLQIPRQQLPGSHVLELTVEEDRERIRLLFEQLIAGRLLSYSTWNRYKGDNGEPKYADVATTGLRDSDNRFSCAVALITDLSQLPRLDMERRAVESLLDATQHELQSKNTALREVLSTIDTERQKYEQELRDSFLAVSEPIMQWLEGAEYPGLEKPMSKLRELVESIRDYGFGDHVTLLKRLSPRELEICEKIKEGLTSKQIADQMKISVETVNKHRFAIRRKLQLRNTHRNLASYLKQL